MSLVTRRCRKLTPDKAAGPMRRPAKTSREADLRENIYDYQRSKGSPGSKDGETK